MNVYIGVYLARLEMPWVQSLKEKRALVKPVVEKLKVRFPVSAARLDGLQAHDWELVGVTAVSADRVWLEGMLRKVEDFLASHGEYRVVESRLDIELWEAF